MGRALPIALMAFALAALAASWFLRSDAQPDVARIADPSAGATELEPALQAIQASAELPTPVIQDHAEVEIPPETDATLAQQLDAVGHVVWGYVLDDRGRPLASANRPGIRLVDELGIFQLAQVDAEGAYSAPGLASGRWYLMAGASGRKTNEATLDLTDEVATVRQDFQLSPQPTVKVKLIGPTGQPFWEEAKGTDLPPLFMTLLAVATSDPPGERFEQILGSPNNRFGVGQLFFSGENGVQLGPEYLGRIDLAVELPVYVSLVLYHDVVETKRVAPGEDEVTFTLDPATIAGRLGSVEFSVVDATTAAPIAGASVMLRKKGQAGPGQASDAGGHVLFDAQLPGLHELSISAEGKAWIRREVDVPRGRRADLGRIAMDAPVPIRGRADDVKGKGLAVELRVVAVPQPGAPVSGLDLQRFPSSTDGTFEVATLPPGVWMIQAQDLKTGRVSANAAESMSPNVVVDTRAGPVENLCLRVERVSAVVARWTGPNPGDLRVRFFDEQEHWRQSSGFSGAAPARTDLPSGFWHMVVSDRQGNLVLERRFSLGAEPVVLELGPAQ